MPDNQPVDPDLEPFADAMRRRFPDADFRRMLENANLAVILTCLRGTWVEQHVGDDVERFRALLWALADQPKPEPQSAPSAKSDPDPNQELRDRIRWLRIVSKACETGVSRSVGVRRDSLRSRPVRPRAGNRRNFDVAPVRRSPGGETIH